LIYLLKMVIFHSLLYVYQTVIMFDSSRVSTNSMVKNLIFSTNCQRWYPFLDPKEHIVG
jgi:hypothetical protein